MKPPDPGAVVGDPVIQSVSTNVMYYRQTLFGSGGPVELLLQDLLPNGRELVAEEGSAIVLEAMQRIEQAVSALLSNRDGLIMQAGIRRVSRAYNLDLQLDSTGQLNLRPQASTNYASSGWIFPRIVADLAIRKYGQWTPVHGVCHAYDHQWTSDELMALARLLELSETYQGLGSWFRRLLRGQALSVVARAPLSCVPVGKRSIELGVLLARFNRRASTPQSMVSMLGQYGPGNPNTSTNLTVFAGSWRPLSDLQAALGGGGTDTGSGLRGPLRLLPNEVLCDWGELSSILEIIDSASHLEPALRSRYGCGLSDVLLVFAGLSVPLVEGLAVGDYISFARLHLYGYTCARWPSQEFWSWVLSRATDIVPPGAPIPTRSSLEAAIKVVTLHPPSNQIDLRRTENRNPIIDLGDSYLYDVLAVPDAVLGLIQDLEAEPPVQRLVDRRLEEQTHSALSALGRQPWPSGRQIKIDGQQATDLDASVIVENVLVAADCFSSPWRTAFNRGDYNRMRNRTDRLRRKLGQWTHIMQRVAAGEARANVDLAREKITHVLPVVVTGAVEFIDTLDSSIWLNDETPRILTVDELVAYLRSGDPSASEHAIPVPPRL